MENAIIAEHRINQLRTISVEALLSLADLLSQYDINHDDILAILRPSGPNVDPIINTINQLVAQAPEVIEEFVQPDRITGKIESLERAAFKLTPEKSKQEERDLVTYWMTPVKSDEYGTAKDTITTLVGEERIYAFGDRTPGRKHIKPNDWICFYEAGNGVVAHARIESHPRNEVNKKVHSPEKYPWIFNLSSQKIYLDDPIILDSSLRSQLDAFKNKDPDQPWGWFVQATRKISKNDFILLTNEQT